MISHHKKGKQLFAVFLVIMLQLSKPYFLNTNTNVRGNHATRFLNLWAMFYYQLQKPPTPAIVTILFRGTARLSIKILRKGSQKFSPVFLAVRFGHLPDLTLPTYTL
jgi:hypothetical protein